MPMMGTKDTIVAKPKFPVERIQDGTITVSCNTAASGATTINFPPGAALGVANGWVANGVNIGSIGVVGFNLIGPKVTNITPNSVTLSSAITGNVAAGQRITFSKPVNYKSNVQANTYNANTYLVTSTRLANASSLISPKGVAHTGWAHVQQGFGYVKGAIILNPGDHYTAGHITVAANTSYPGGSGANIAFSVNANGGIISTSVNSNGGGYAVTPTITLPATSGNAAVIQLVMGGRANRIQTEVLAVTSNAHATDTGSGGIWWSGV